MTSPTPPDEPRYGQRADSGSPMPGPDAPRPSDPQSPWPQYGQVAGQSAPSYSQYTGAGEQAAPAPGPTPPYGAPAGGQGQWSAPAAPSALPSRVPGVITLVLGIITMLVIAPIAAFMGVLGGIGGGVGGLLESTTVVPNHSTVTVDESGTLLVSTSTVNVYSCEATGPSGTVALEGGGSVSQGFIGINLTPGRYVLDCQGEGDFMLTAMTGTGVDDLTSAGVSAMLWGTIAGIVGLVLTIVGIILIVRANSRRRQILQQSPLRY
ncbi:hypothetical protein M3T53_00820 [Actinomyces sp. B33]|uniref:hypothetical protein n=1 Tax=Actinomyces sp. B33 TaxID=2942131 RepID=UPI00234120EF|nr:hypothetical protein [Actinomyces sp. B33]MDC4232260.1 hypothetical protein [Actinomyces sp. B33]